MRRPFLQYNIRLKRKTSGKAQERIQMYTRKMKSRWWEKSNRTSNGSRQKGHESILYRPKKAYMTPNQVE